MLLIFLQNAYGVENGYIPSYSRNSFANSHTGRRLKEALPLGYEFEIRNANPSIGDNPDSCFKPDIAYMTKQVMELQPKLILACGKIAQKGLENIETDVPIIKMPHPAYRALSKKITGEVRGTIEDYYENS